MRQAKVLSKLRLSWQRILIWVATLLLLYPIAKAYFCSIYFLMVIDSAIMLNAMLLIVLLLFDIIKRSPLSFLLLSFSLLSYFGILAALFCAIDSAYVFYIFPALLLALGYCIIFSSDEIRSVRLKRSVNYLMIKVLFIATILLQVASLYLLINLKSEYIMHVILVIGSCSIIIASLFIKDYRSLRIVSMVWYAIPLFFSVCYFDYEIWENLYRLVCLFWPLNTIVPVLGIALSYSEPFLCKK